MSDIATPHVAFNTVETVETMNEGLVEKLKAHKMQFKTVSYLLVEVEEAYIHCSLHIPILEKVEDAEVLKKFPKGTKGGDAFEVEFSDRAWVTN
jgi:hypothetical protein